MPSTRVAASRTVAKAGTSRSSSVAPLASSCAELGRSGAQLGVGQRLHLGLQRVDRLDPRPRRLDAAIVGGAENLAGEAAETDHPMVLSIRNLAGGAPAEPAVPSEAQIQTTKSARKTVLDAKTKDR